MGCSEVFNCSVGSSNFSVLNFVVVIVYLENVASELLQLCFLFLLSCLISCFGRNSRNVVHNILFNTAFSHQ